ncbi:unnamed protein product [Microthlaspi erraticum]|uniref:NYN domain-containing protein n=1 Tax=Microthlaspi erraticum TaxID=1685480 RepID=A0A6D2KBX8_9BRAS|nr:unnamed protein product [Microthlaspi erraticum]
MWLQCFSAKSHFGPRGEQSYHRLKIVKEIADRILLGHMLSHADQEGRYSVVLVATADKDFTYATRDLREHGYKILSVVMDGRESKVAEESTAYWYWNDMQEGNTDATVNSSTHSRRR